MKKSIVSELLGSFMDFFKPEKKDGPEFNHSKSSDKIPSAGAEMSYKKVFSVSYDGEKNLGEMGPIKDYFLDYGSLRLRSWQSQLENDVASTIINKFTLWMISTGLKLQASPNKVVLKSENIDLDTEKFNEIAEARFTVWGKSKMSSYSGMANLHKLAKRAFKNSRVGGDVLVVLRVVKGTLKIQLIDGAHVCSPMFGNAFYSTAKESGNEIKNGVELSATGEHVAYYVHKNGTMDSERILAKSKSTGLVMAYLVYGNEYRLDNVRGMPIIATCLETLAKLERYKEATVAGAEERAKIVMQIVHQQFSTGENVLIDNMAKAFNADAKSELPVDHEGNKLANTVAATTNKSVYNMPIGSELKALDSKMELQFKEFFGSQADIICAAVGIPPNVAFSIYNDSFSASRAATKDWEHTIVVNRDDFSFQFYQPIYDVFLYVEILKNKISAVGYLEAFAQDNEMVLEAYQNARFTGPMFPHIDPVKEVKAEREKLGPLGAHIPLTTAEAATEALNAGDSDSNMEQFSEELAQSKKLGLEIKEEKPPIKKPLK
jgi:capsid protein